MTNPTPLNPLRDALNDVVTKSTWRPDNTVLIHDGTAWNTLVGRIVMATSGDYGPRKAVMALPGECHDGEGLGCEADPCVENVSRADVLRLLAGADR